jgi:sarcosine oxidase subunit gamma
MTKRESDLTVDLSTRRANSLATLAGSVRSVSDANLSVLPDAAKLIFRGRPAAIQAVGDLFGIALPRDACRFVEKQHRSVFWLGPDEWMFQAVGEDATELMDSLELGLTEHPHSLVDVSHRSDAFAVAGPRSSYLLNHGCPLDLSLEAFPVGMCTRTIYAKATILLSRPQQDTFHIDVWRSFAPYVWELLDEVRGEFA